MQIAKATSAGAVCALLMFSITALAPVCAEAGTFGKIVNSITYPVKKVGKNASVDTHKAIGHNSVQTAPNTGGTEKQVVKPDGHKVPAN